MEEGTTSKKVELNDRIKQIRLFLFNDSNRKFASEIGEIEQTMSQICLNKRNAGLEIIQKILDNLPAVDANWLLRGKGKMLIERNGKMAQVQDSLQTSVENHGFYVNDRAGNNTYYNHAELMNLVTSQQKTIQDLTTTIKILTTKKYDNFDIPMAAEG